MHSVLLIGFGQLLQPCSQHLQQLGIDWHAIRRSPSEDQRVCQFDVRQPWPQTLHAKIVVITISSYGRTADDYRASYLDCAQGIADAISSGRLQCQQVIWVSSTSVWGQAGNVDEQTPPLPSKETAAVLLAAEQRMRTLGVPSCVLRLAGLYGGGSQWLIQQWQNGNLALNHYSHRLHRQDASRLLAWLAERYLGGTALPATLIGYDGQATPGEDIAGFFSEQLGESAATNSNRAKPCKRIVSTQLQQLGFRCQYHDFRSGYAEIVQRYREGRAQAD